MAWEILAVTSLCFYRFVLEVQGCWQWSGRKYDGSQLLNGEWLHFRGKEKKQPSMEIF